MCSSASSTAVAAAATIPAPSTYNNHHHHHHQQQQHQQQQQQQRAGMFDVQNIYGTPQVPRKKHCLRPRRMTLIDLRNVPLTEDEVPQRKASSGTVRSEGGGLSHYSKSGIWHIHDSTDSLPSSSSSSSSAALRGSMRIKNASEGTQDGSSRFPKLEECAHFHYDFVDFGSLQVNLCDDDRENYRHNEAEKGEVTLLVRVSCNNKAWTVRRTLSHFNSLDRQLHRCIFDRKFSHLPELQTTSADVKNSQVEQLLQNYLKKFSELAGPMINCGSILNWLEMDNRGNRLLAVDDSGINTPAIAAAHAVKRYNAQAADEISLQVGDIVSVIDMPPAEDTIWWRGKRGFEVGFFPGECVEVIGDKVPPSMTTVMPATASLTSSSSPGNTLTPLSTPATARKPCEMDNCEDTASMIRKHGKLMSFLRTFFSTRPPRNQLKQSGIVKERVFGCDLGEHLLNSGHDVPLVLKSCAEVIERYGIVDGIYRLSGVTSNIQKLRVAFDEDQVPELMESTYLQDIHSISSLLKMYFRELPNPLLTYQLYDKFAAAVRDEDNKLLRIHDVVQQLPPPHYRTLQYLMRHLERVASHAFETGMHSKNLAIVWAPNLLRSKELEQGGGAAALQGVGIQAVVTECLICYCDLIFNDKMPAHNSPHLQKSQKKPRPKSLAISTPTRLLSLEEARERAFLGSLAQSQRFIDVGGGPANLPPNYHTVIDLPGYKKKSNKDTNKGKKSPVSGWKSIFSKPRAGSVKKARKGSVQGAEEEQRTLASVQAKALTEEDVHNWKRRLRSAKSAESLISVTPSARSSISSHTSSSLAYSDSTRRKDERRSPYHKRSLSSDASSVIHHHCHVSPCLEPVASPSGLPPSHPSPPPPLHPSSSSSHAEGAAISPGTHRSRTDRRPEQPRKQSFVRGDSTRKALHRRTPSAPNTPRLDRDRENQHQQGGNGKQLLNNQHHNHQQKSSSQPHLDSLSPSSNSDSSLLSSPMTDNATTSLGIDIDAAIKSRLQQMASQSRNARASSSSSAHGSPVSPPEDKRRHRSEDEVGDRRGETEKRKMEQSEEVLVELRSSPGSHRRHDPVSPIEPTSRFFVSRYHDYAEILSDDEGCRDESAPTSTTDMQELVDKLDSKLSSASRFYLRDSEDVSEPEPKLPKMDADKPAADKTQVVKRTIEHVRAGSGSSTGSVPSTQVARRRAEWIPSERAPTSEQSGIGGVVEFPELTPRSPGSGNHSYAAALPPIPQRHHQQATGQHGSGSSNSNSVALHQSNMSKCLSVPSDIAQSLENITASQNDLLSSVTLSELSQSVNSFSAGGPGDDSSPSRDHPRWRRSTSLDSIEAERESSLCRTLRDINAQMDLEFHEKVERAMLLEEEGYSRHGGEDDASRLTPLHISEDNLVTPTALHETHFPATPETPTAAVTACAGVQGDATRGNRDRIDADSDYDPDYAVIADRDPVVSDNTAPSHHPEQPVVQTQPAHGSQTDFPDYAVIDKSRRKTAANKKSDTDRERSEVSGVSVQGVDVCPPPKPDGQITSHSGYTEIGQVSTDESSLSSGKVVKDLQTEEVVHGMREEDVSASNHVGSQSAGDVFKKAGPHWAQSEMSTGVCVVKRQRNSSSSSTGSTDSLEGGNSSDDGAEVVYDAQTSESGQPGAKVGGKGQTVPACDVSHHPANLNLAHSAAGPAGTSSSEVPSDLRQFSPDDILWRQNPLCGQASEGSDDKASEGGGWLGFHSQSQGEGGVSHSINRSGAIERNPKTMSGPSEPCPGSSSDRSLPEAGSHPSQGLSREFSGEKFHREDLPIISGCAEPFPSSPSSQRSLLPSPKSPTLSGLSSFQSSGLPCPRSPTLSCPSTSQSSAPSTTTTTSRQSRIPSPRSPTSSVSQNPLQEMEGTGAKAQSSSVPLHLMLYHPQEFQAPPAAVSSGTGCPLPQVHVKSDMVMEEKAVIRKSSTGRVPSVNPPHKEVAERQTVVSGSDTGSPPAPADTRQQTASLWPPSSDTQTGPSGGMQLGKAEQDSMEVDNLCNRLVDELHAVGSQSEASGCLEDDDRVPAAVASPARGTLQVEAVVERRVEETEVGGEAIVEERLVRVESFGEVQDEEMENALNVGKEMLMAHASSSSSSSSPTSIHIATTTTTSTTATTATTSAASNAVIASSSSSSSSSTSSSSVSPQSQGKPSSERRLSASKIPRFNNKRADSREEKNVVSDVSQGDLTVVAAAVSVSSSSSSSYETSAKTSPRSKDCSSEQTKNLMPRSSKIPLSQKIPSPTGSFRELKATKPSTSPSSPKQVATPSGNKSQNSGKAPIGPVPRTRTSIHKSDHVAPPAEEVMEIARPSVKKRTSLNAKGDRNVASMSAKEPKGANKSVGAGSGSGSQQEVKIEKGDAKLVIDKQPNLKKKIQTVHARKVPHPPRQMAEALDSDACDSPPADLSSTGPSDLDHSGLSSQEDEVFSDESLRLGVGRDRSFSSGTGVGGRSPRFLRQPPSPSSLLEHADSYQHMTGSRSSLDDSTLQLAAERQEDFIPNWDSSAGVYSTGSLRSSRSQKMRSLMEVFERGNTGSHSSEDSGEVKVKERSGSTSGSTTISVGSQDKEPDTDDDIFQPPGPPRLPLSLTSRRSRSRERGGRGGSSLTSPHRRPSQSPSARKPSTGKADEAVLRRRRPSPMGRNSSGQNKTPSKSEGGGVGVGFGRPPRHRNASRGRTYSDSSTSESDNTQHLESGRSSLDSLSRSRGPPRGRQPDDSAVLSRTVRQSESLSSGTAGSVEEKCPDDFPEDEPKVSIQRQGSIKELRQLFEKGPKEDVKDSGRELSPPVTVRRSVRTRSVSPGSENPTPVIPNIMRHSMEIPSSSSILKQRETQLTSQPLRLGPKPFYGSKK